MSGPRVASDGGVRRAAEALASSLAGRLAAVVPNGIEVANDEGTVWVSDGAWRSEKELDDILACSSVGLPPDFRRRGIEEGLDASDVESTVGAADPNAAGDPSDLREAIAMAAGNVLSSVQDFVVEHLRLPWPSDPESLSDQVLPDARAEWDGSILRLWFGNAAHPVLELPAISTSTLFE